ncbi:MAG: hypothetical protein M3Q45_09215 [Chloroflexota bacterium]|nr:hypothetical protein [Chloroflexota bacterium]
MGRFQASIDESEKFFLPKERRIAELLASEGKQVKAKKERTGQRTGDAEVNGVLTEFKTLTPLYADNATVRNTINNSIRQGGQARHIIIDARNSSLTAAEAHRGLARARNITRGLPDRYGSNYR